MKNSSPSRLSFEILYENIEKAGRKVFLDGHDTVILYSDLKRSINRFCGVFSHRKLQTGDRVLIITQRDDIAITCFIAAMLDGLVPVLLAPDSGNRRIEAIADLTEPALVLVDWEREKTIFSPAVVSVHKKARSSYRGLGPVKNHGLDLELSEATLRAPNCPAEDSELAYIVFTSGTTSCPKGVQISQKNLCANLETISRVFDFCIQSKIFNGASLAHADGLIQGPLLALANGCTVIRPEAFSVSKIEDFLNTIRAKSATHFISTPTVYSMIVEYAQYDDYFDAPEFEAMISSAAKLERSLWDRLETRFSRPVYNQYGLTETVACALYSGAKMEMGEKYTIGKPIDCEVKLVPLKGGEESDPDCGELWIKGENVFAGYYKDSGKNAQSLHGRWLKTGDLVKRTSKGSYQFGGRLDDMITSGGFSIQAEEVNEACLAHKDVKDVITVGIPDEEFGEIVVSVVLLKNAVSEEELTRHCREYLEAFKVPKRIIPVSEIPRSSAGKPLLGPVREYVIKCQKKNKSSSSDTRIRDIFEIASQVFRLPVNSLRWSSSVDDIEGWDSYTHINLILQCEQDFSIRLPTSSITKIRNLKALADEIRKII